MEDQKLTEDTGNPTCDNIISTDPVKVCGGSMQKNGTSKGGQSWICSECGKAQYRFKQVGRGRPRKFNSRAESNKHHNDLKAARLREQKEQTEND